VEVARQSTASETIEQGLAQIRPSRRDRAFAEKRAVLRALIEREGAEFRNAIIFCNRKVDVDVVAKSLKKHGMNAEPIHGDLDQSHRTRTLDGFREGRVTLLVASDVAARGLDIPNVSHVFNFDVPSHAEDYVHRIGRTGRAGRTGKALTIATPSDEKYLDAIQSLIGGPIPTIESPAIDAPAEERGESPRSERPARGRSRRKAAEPAPTAEPAEPAPAEESAPKAAETAPAEDSAPPAAEPARRPSRGRGRREEREDAPVVGMGDHVPDFLTRSFLDQKAG
jgi:ATP-dependent RNA helicase RhlE